MVLFKSSSFIYFGFSCHALDNLVFEDYCINNEHDDDSDDSNDENNWRNDYPDEDPDRYFTH